MVGAFCPSSSLVIRSTLESPYIFGEEIGEGGRVYSETGNLYSMSGMAM